MSAAPTPPTSISHHIAWRPDVLDISQADDRDRFDQLLDGKAAFTVHDTLAEQLDELIQARHPQRKFEPVELAEQRSRILGPTPEQFGRWVFYPWSGSLVRLLPPSDFRCLRAARNRHKIMADEQAALATKTIGVVGRSVGLAAAVTLALEGIGGRFRLADFDTIGLSNLNRLRARVCDLGVNKAVLAARQLFEIDPYLDVEIFPDGIREESPAAFFGDAVPLDVLVEECDDLWAKVRLREEARGRRVPVVMDTSDRDMIDVERYDLDPMYPPFHELAGAVRSEDVRALTPPARMGLVAAIVEVGKLSAGARRSLPEIGKTITTWPQLASAVALGGAVTADVVRRILLGTFTASGRYRVDVEQLVSDRPHNPDTPPRLRKPSANASPNFKALTHGHGGRAFVVSSPPPGVPMSLAERLQAKTTAVITRTESHPAYWLFFDPADPLGQAGTAALLRNILLQSAHFGDHMTEAVFTAIGRFPKAKPQRMKPLVEQVLDEVFHPELAGRDFVRMGGDPALLAPANGSPAAFVVAAVCRMLGERHSSFSYLGFVALMEATTPILTERLMPVLEKHGLARWSKFVPLHATEDHAHAATLWEEIAKVAETFPDAEPAVEFGFDALALVYPTLIWDEALRLMRTDGFVGA